MVLDGFLAQLHYNWYHLVAVKHVHLILLLLLLVLKVWVSCPMLPILLCVHLIPSFFYSFYGGLDPNLGKSACVRIVDATCV